MLESAQDKGLTVDATLQVPLVTAQIVRFDFKTPIDSVLVERRGHWLDLCLTPRLRNARACYTEHWSAGRFEPLGDTYLVPQGQALHTRGDCGSHAAIICLLHSVPTQRWFEDDLQWTDWRLKSSLDIRSSYIRSLLLRLGDEARNPGFASEALAEHIAGQLVIEIARYYRAPPPTRVAKGLAPWRLRLIDDRLAQDLSSPSLSELSKLCMISVRQLTRAFRRSRSCSLGDYIMRNRLENAKRLLLRDQNIKTVAYLMGFASPAAFSHAFRCATGESPRAYRCRIHGVSRGLT